MIYPHFNIPFEVLVFILSAYVRRKYVNNFKHSIKIQLIINLPILQNYDL